MENFGLVYVAFGYEYLLMATHSAYTARSQNPGIKCILVTNIKISNPLLFQDSFQLVIYEKTENEHNRDIKLSAINYADCQKGAYIDCDTIICGDLSPMVKCLDRYDVILKLNARPTNKKYQIDEGVSGNLFPFYNGGLVFFRNNDSAKKMFSEWLTYFREFGKRSDQPALAKAVYMNPDIRILTVGCIWNTFPADESLLTTKGHISKSRILHYREAKDYPEIAKDIMKYHRKLSDSIHCDNFELAEDIAEIESKYSLITSWWYQHRLIRNIVLKIIMYMQRFGCLSGFTMVRKRYRTSGQFENMSNE